MSSTNLVLNFHSVAPEVAHSETPQCLSLPNSSLALLEEIYGYENDIQSQINSLPDSNKLVADILSTQNRKLTALAQLVLSAQSENKANGSDVEFTSAGVDFSTTEALIPGRFINLEIFAPSHGSTLIAFAQVTHCQTTNSQQHRLSTRFHRLTEKQQQALAKLY
ncbi:MAG: hypothetical protein K6L73_12285 [Cellvibrionaceae bacterium]